MGKIIGIDLGTTNSVVAIMDGGEATVVTNPSGTRTTPSVVCFRDNGERLVGAAAKNQAAANHENTVFSIKRFMGRRRGEVKSEERLVPYKITGGDEEAVKVQIGKDLFTPPEVSAMILSYMKKYAEAYLGEPVTEAVITVPAYFNDAQRNATKDAGEIAGLKVRRIINEPTAAALAYSLDKRVGEKILVFDLGGGTFDVSVLEIGEGVVQVVSTNGDTHLGGDDYDQAIIDLLTNEFKKKHGFDLRNDRQALARLKEVAEKAKIDLSSMQATDIIVQFIATINGTGVHLSRKMTRTEFEEITRPLTERCRKPVEQALTDAKLTAADIQQVVLVGGSTRVPAVHQLVVGMFGKEPNMSVNPDEVVAIGAAIQGAVLDGSQSGILLLDVTPLSLGVETQGGIMTVMIPRNTTIPTNKDEDFTTAYDSQRDVDIKVFQGERKLTKDCRKLDEFKLEMPPAPKGTPKVKVTFNIDANGILNVSAKDLATNKDKSVQVKGSSGLSREQVERFKAEAEAHADDDEKRAQMIEAQNKADGIIYRTERALKDATTLDPAVKAEIEAKVKMLKAAKDGGETASDVEEAIADVEKVVGVLYEKKVEAKAPAPEPQPVTAAGGADGDEGFVAE